MTEDVGSVACFSAGRYRMGRTSKGGEQGNSVERTGGHEPLTHTQRAELETKMSEQAIDPAEETPASASEDEAPAPEPAALPKKSMPKIEYVVSLIGAVLLVGLLAWMTPESARTGWGFNRPGALERELPADDYLNHLATAAKEWFSQRPETKDALAERLTHFINGCEALSDAPHPQLAEDDRNWLRKRGEAWTTTLQEHLTELKSGAKTVEEVREAADETVEKLMTELRTRAKDAAA